MINLFIDTNIFLSFYHLTNEDLEELKKLAALIDNSEIQLFLPDQIKNEFTRNRSAKIVDAMRKLQEAKFNLSFPLFAKDYAEYDEWPAPGSEDTELGVLMEREVRHGAAKVHARVQA